MLYVIQVCWQLSSKIRFSSWSCSPAVSKPVWHIPLLCVQWRTPDDGQRKCPKHVEFYSKNKFEILVHPAGFIIRTYHLPVPIVRKSGGFNLLQPYRSVIGLHRDCFTLLCTVNARSLKMRNNATCKSWIFSKIYTNLSETHKWYKIWYARGGGGGWATLT